MIFKWYDNYQKVNMEVRFWEDLRDIYFDTIALWQRYSNSEWTWWTIECLWHSPDVENYEPKRWSDLNFNLKYI